MNQFLKIIDKYKYLIIVLLSFFIIELSWIIISPVNPPYSTPDSQVRFRNIQNYAKGINVPVVGEASPLFYSIDSNIDKLVINTRIYSQFRLLEMISVLFSFITLTFTYKIFKLLFDNEEKIAITGTILVALFPMFTYMGMAIDLDALVFAMYTAFIYYSLKLLKNKFNLKDFILLTLFLILGLLSKQNMYVNIPIYIGITIYLLYKNGLLKKYLKYLILSSILIIGAVFSLHSGLNSTVLPRIEEFFKSNNNYNLLDYTYYNLFSYTTNNGIIFLSFFGIYGYVAQELQPVIIFSLIQLIVYVIFVGLVINIFNKVKNKQLNKIHIYIITQIILTFLFLYLLDYSSVKNYAGFFTEGRYFFPIISLIILGFIIGLRTFISKKYYNQLYLFMVILMIFFNIISLRFLFLSRL